MFEHVRIYAKTQMESMQCVDVCILSYKHGSERTEGGLTLQKYELLNFAEKFENQRKQRNHTNKNKLLTIKFNFFNNKLASSHALCACSETLPFS